MAKLRNWLVQLIFIGLGLLVSLICVFSISLFFAEPYITYKLTPPKYPNSQLISVESGGGSGGAWEKSIYGTTDDLDKVLVFFEGVLPGFKEIELQFTPSPVYYNSIAYDGWLNKFAFYDDHYGSVTIYSDLNDKSATFIEVDVGYLDY